MLALLNLNQAILHILHWLKKIDDLYSPETLNRVLNEKALRVEFWRLHMFLQNAIDAKELPALMKPKPKAEERRMIEKVGVPEEFREMLPKYQDIWITWEDLHTFLERPATVSDSSFAHSRDSLARVAWLLIKKAGLSLESATLQRELDELVIDLDAQEINCKLGETTLKGCVREILAAGNSMSEGD